MPSCLTTLQHNHLSFCLYISLSSLCLFIAIVFNLRFPVCARLTMLLNFIAAHPVHCACSMHCAPPSHTNILLYFTDGCVYESVHIRKLLSVLIICCVINFSDLSFCVTCVLCAYFNSCLHWNFIHFSEITTESIVLPILYYRTTAIWCLCIELRFFFFCFVHTLSDGRIRAKEKPNWCAAVVNAPRKINNISVEFFFVFV